MHSLLISTPIILLTLFLGGCFHVPAIVPPRDTLDTGQPGTTEAGGSPSTTATAEIDTSDWLTYTNEEYEVSFKYPREWGAVNVGLPKNIIRVQHSGKTQKEGTEFFDGAMFTVMIIEKAAQDVLEDKYIPSSHSRSAQSFNGADAIISEGQNEFAGNVIESSYESYVIVSVKNNSYIISLSSIGDKYQLYQDQLALILSTMKFTP